MNDADASAVSPPSSLFPMPLGTVVAYAGNADAATRGAFATAGWLFCDGQAVSREVYRNLYVAIGDSHGQGDGSTTFNLPDYRGRFLRGVDSGANRDPDAQNRSASGPGGQSGDAVGSVQSDAFREHQHDVVEMIGDNNVDGVDSTVTHSDEHHNEPRKSGKTGGNETRPVNCYVHWLIVAGVPAT